MACKSVSVNCRDTSPLSQQPVHRGFRAGLSRQKLWGCSQGVSGMQGRAALVPLPGLPLTGSLPAPPVPLGTQPEWAVARPVPQPGREQVRPGQDPQRWSSQGNTIGASRAQGTPLRPAASCGPSCPGPQCYHLAGTQGTQQERPGRAGTGGRSPNIWKASAPLPVPKRTQPVCSGGAPSAPVEPGRRGRRCCLFTELFSQDAWRGAGD